MQPKADVGQYQVVVLVSLTLLIATLVATLTSAGLNPQVVA